MGGDGLLVLGAVSVAGSRGERASSPLLDFEGLQSLAFAFRSPVTHAAASLALEFAESAPLRPLVAASLAERSLAVASGELEAPAERSVEGLSTGGGCWAAAAPASVSAKALARRIFLRIFKRPFKYQRRQ